LRSDHYVFEFGCGTGSTALALAAAAKRFVASDLSSASLCPFEWPHVAMGIPGTRDTIERHNGSKRTPTGFMEFGGLVRLA
jgi:cyclopropane fatty-acyl-phospholipid synthase-like methyltransferase